MSSKLRVLVVDDEVFLTNYLKRILEKLGCEVNSVDDGHKVGKALLAFDPELIFLDLIMPEIDGVEIVDLLGEAKSKARLVLMSGLDQRTVSSVGEVARGHGLDVLAAITKPFKPAKIEELVKPLIESRGQAKAAAGKPISLPGPQLRYKVEQPLVEPAESDLKWYRVRLVWKLDDEQVIDFMEIVDDSAKKGISKGLLNLCFNLLAAPEGGVKAQGDQIGLKIPLSLPILLHASAPNYLEACAKRAGLKKQAVSFEISETAITGASDVLLNSLSRLKIKGFKIAVRVCTEVDRVLAVLNKLPVDELVLDMAHSSLKGTALNNSETEFQVASLVSYAAKNNLITTAINLTTSEQLAFAKQCSFNRVSGSVVK